MYIYCALKIKFFKFKGVIFMENLTEEQIWQNLKKDLVKCKESNKAIEIAQTAILNALKKRGKSETSSQGIAKIYQAVKSCKNIQNKLKILATGKDLTNKKLTGFKTSWDNDIKRLFSNLLSKQIEIDNKKINESKKLQEQIDKRGPDLYKKLVSFFDCKDLQTNSKNALDQQFQLIKMLESKEQIEDVINKDQIAFFNVNINKRAKGLITNPGVFETFLEKIDGQLDAIQNNPIKYLKLIDSSIGNYGIYNNYIRHTLAPIICKDFGVTKETFLNDILDKSNIYFKNLLVVSYFNKFKS